MVCAACGQKIQDFYKFKTDIASNQLTESHQSHICRCCLSNDNIVSTEDHALGSEYTKKLELILLCEVIITTLNL